MGRQKQGDRVVGVYGCRVIYVEGGERCSEALRTEAEAARHAARIRERLQRQAELTIGDALKLYLADRGASWASGSEQVRRHGIETFFCDLDVPLVRLTAETCAELYERLRTTPRANGRLPAAASHRQWLLVAKIFLRWCVDKKLLTTTPLAAVRPKDRANAGKPQLRREELRKLLGVARAAAEAGDPLALAILLIFWCGASPSEVMRRQVRDLDDGCRWLCIDDAAIGADGKLQRQQLLKTKNRRRERPIPADLRPLLARHIDGRAGDARLFPLERQRPARAILERLDRLCAEAGVPRVVPYSLRGTLATQHRERGDSIEDIATVLGNTPAIAAKHYVADGAGQQAAQSRLAEAMADPREREIAELKARLAELTATAR